MFYKFIVFYVLTAHDDHLKALEQLNNLTLLKFYEHEEVIQASNKYQQ